MSVHRDGRVNCLSWTNLLVACLRFQMFLWFMVHLLFLSQAIAESENYQLAPEPSWIIPARLSDYAQFDKSTVVGGVDYLLVDRQIQVSDSGADVFFQQSMEVLNRTGAEEVSQISIDFDPSYQSLTVHRIDIVRDGQRLDRFNPKNVNLLRREQSLESLIYDGTTTFHTILEDIRPGDIIHYSYTVHGRNPVFQEKFYGGYSLQWSVPVRQARIRMLFPSERKIMTTQHRSKITPTTRKLGTFTETVWDQSDISALNIDPSTPNWFDPYAWLQFTETSSWEEVRQWADNLYRLNDIDAGISELAGGFHREYETREERIVAVLNFVQEEVRYLGIEINQGSHLPSKPEEVLNRRYGDCKDKTILMVALLRSLDIESYPALVSTSRRQAVEELSPSPLVFNHVLVQVRHNGKIYWLDPTRSNQGGNLPNLYQPDYGRALVIDGESTSLTSMPKMTPIKNKRNIFEHYDFPKGIGGVGRLTVTTDYLGYQADRMRMVLEENGPEKIQNNYLEFYSKRYPGVIAAKDLVVTDDSKANKVVITEYYKIPDVWILNDKKDYRVFSFYPSELNGRSSDVGNVTRTMPLDTGGITSISEWTTIDLAGEWDIEPEESKVVDLSFDFTKKVALKSGLLHVDYDYQSFSDHVEVGRLENYRTNIMRMDDALGYSLEYPVGGEFNATPVKAVDTLNWLLVVIISVISILFCYLAYWLNGYDPEPDVSGEIESDHVKGIGGWLLLPLLGLIVSPFILIFDSRELLFVFNLQQWNLLTMPGSDNYIPYFAPLAIFEVVVNIATLLLNILALWLFFSRRSSTPRIYISYLLFVVAALIIDYVAGTSIPLLKDEYTSNDLAKVVRHCISTVIWVAYFMRSKRVAETFVERRKERIFVPQGQRAIVSNIAAR